MPKINEKSNKTNKSTINKTNKSTINKTNKKKLNTNNYDSDNDNISESSINKKNDSDNESFNDEESEKDDADNIDDEPLDEEENNNDDIYNEYQESDKEDNESSDDGTQTESESETEDYINNEETLSKKCYKKYISINLGEISDDDDNNIIKHDRLTKPILTKFERVRILSVRTKQLAQGAKPMIKNCSNLSSREIALQELKNKIIPFIIERPVPNAGIEKWKLSELEIND